MLAWGHLFEESFKNDRGKNKNGGIKVEL